MNGLARLATVWLLVIALITTPNYALAMTAQKFSANFVMQVQSGRYDRALVLAKYGAGSLQLQDKARNLTFASGKTIGQTLVNDVLQTLVIMAVSAAAHLAKERAEKDRVLQGHTLSYEQARQYSMQAAEDLLCASSSTQPSIGGEIVCSGDLWMGFLGAWAGAAGVATSAKILKFLLRNGPTRSALIQTVGTFATSFLVLGGFMMGADLWTESVTVMNDATKEAQAHGLFGRAAANLLSGRWNEYRNTADGQLAAEVFSNMYSILRVDPDRRATWFWNSWRFGVARGDLLMNLAILQGAMTAGSATGATLAAYMGWAAWPAWATGIAASMIFGGTIAAAMVYAPDWEVGQRLTGLIQSARSWVANRNYVSARARVAEEGSMFDINLKWTGELKSVRNFYLLSFPPLLPELARARMDWVNIAIERYNELRVQVEKAESWVTITKEVIRNSKLKDKVMVADGGEIMTYSQAQAKYCPVIARTAARSNCEFPLSVQVQKLTQARATLVEARSAMESLAREILNNYDADLKLFESLRSAQFNFGFNLAFSIQSDYEKLNVVSQSLQWNFASYHPNIAQERGLTFDDPAQASAMQQVTANFLARAYVSGLDEDAVVKAAQLAQADREVEP